MNGSNNPEVRLRFCQKNGQRIEKDSSFRENLSGGDESRMMETRRASFEIAPIGRKL
jgi:hypothetical protein